MTIHFDFMTTKFDSEGNEILSSTLEEGETLTSGITYAQVLHNGTIPAVPSDTQLGSLGINTDETEHIVLDPSLDSTLPAGIARDSQDESVQAPNDAAKEEAEASGETTETVEPTAVDPEVPAEETSEEEVPARPKDYESKSVWFEYAKTFGYEGTEDENSKQFFIDNYGN
jgi:hypothetical protein